MCIFYVQLLWEYLAICQRAHNHSLTSPESREETVKFIASESKSRKSFLTCPPPMANVASAVCTCVCVCGGVCVLCVVVLPALAYFIFQLPAYAHDFNPAASAWRSRLELPLLLLLLVPAPRLSLSYFFRLDVCKGNHAFKALYLFTPLAP